MHKSIHIFPMVGHSTRAQRIPRRHFRDDGSRHRHIPQAQWQLCCRAQSVLCSHNLSEYRQANALSDIIRERKAATGFKNAASKRIRRDTVQPYAKACHIIITAIGKPHHSGGIGVVTLRIIAKPVGKASRQYVGKPICPAVYSSISRQSAVARCVNTDATLTFSCPWRTSAI